MIIVAHMTTTDHTAAISPATGRLSNAFRSSTEIDNDREPQSLKLLNVPLGGTGKVPAAKQNSGTE